MLKKHVFLLAFIFSFNFLISQNVFADSYFSRILSGMSGRNLDTHEQVFATTNELPLEKINTFGFLKNIFRPITNLQIFQKPQDTTPATIDRETNNQFLDNTNNPYFENPAPQIVTTQNTSNIQNSTTSTSTTKQSDSYLSIILQKLGILTPTPTTPTQNPQNQLSSLLKSLGGGQGGSQGGMGGQNPGGNNNNFGGNSGGVEKYQAGQPLGSGQQSLATPYAGPGGSLPGDCGIPKGPIAYNIAEETGSGVRCNSKTTIVGYKGTLSKLSGGTFGGGYMTPLIPPFAKNELQKYGGGTISAGDGYGVKRFSDYSSQNATAYIDEQILHWKKEGLARGQKCVPVDLDNCDSAGSANYKKVLDRIEEFNSPEKSGGVMIKVLTKNPQSNGCNFFSHPVVVGAFIEEISLGDAQKVSQMRNKPEQVLLFAAGSGSKSPGGGGNANVKKIEMLKIPNSAYSYDSGAEYQNVYDCTYNQ
jgi:hypothetical protein